VTWWESRAFKAQQAEWYGVLRDTGFRDIEPGDGSLLTPETTPGRIVDVALEVGCRERAQEALEEASLWVELGAEAKVFWQLIIGYGFKPCEAWRILGHKTHGAGRAKAMALFESIKERL